MQTLQEKLAAPDQDIGQETAKSKAVQRKSGLKVVDYLRRQGAMSETELTEFVCAQLKIDRYSPEKYPAGPELAGVLPEELARKHLVVPLRRAKDILWVATADPVNVDVLGAIEHELRISVEPVFCPREELGEVMAAVYGGGAAMADMQDLLDALEVETGKEEEPGAVIAPESLDAGPQDAPVIRLVNQILAQAVRSGASDVHLSPRRTSAQFRLRLDGELQEYPAPPKQMFPALVSRIKLLSGMDISITRSPQDGRFSFQIDNREINVRVSTLPTIYGENLVLRMLVKSSRTLSLDTLGICPEDQTKIETAIGKPHGMILATGPTGSGKTTLLYAVLQLLDKPNVNIITIEDPVEYRIDTIRQVQLNIKAGMTFADGLRSILRQDPDVIMIGEIRDRETANIAVESAMTGHQVLSTAHTNDAAGAITRFTEMGVEPFLVASTLLCAVGQRLVRTNCPNCSQPYDPPPRLVAALQLAPGETPAFCRGTGCAKCQRTGFLGRTGVYEVLFVDEMVQGMIMSRASSREITRAAVKAGTLRTMQADARSKAIAGVTALEEAAPVIFM